tara:strand:- start:59 stop:346 length:288 start_codon:yes stop_codon:yes gene_type:complete
MGNYKLEIEVNTDLEDFKVEGDLLSLIEGVAYIQEVYKEYEGFTQDKILETIIKVLDIERLRGIDNKKYYYSFYNIDSFVREQVFDIITRELDNE